MFKLLTDIASIRVATVHTESIILTIVIQFPLDLLTKDHHSKDLINLKKKKHKNFNADYSLQITHLLSSITLLSLRQKSRHTVPPTSFDSWGNPGDDMETSRTLQYPEFQDLTWMNDMLYSTWKHCVLSWKRPGCELTEWTPVLTTRGNVTSGMLFNFTCPPFLHLLNWYNKFHINFAEN